MSQRILGLGQPSRGCQAAAFERFGKMTGLYLF